MLYQTYRVSQSVQAQAGFGHTSSIGALIPAQAGQTNLHTCQTCPA